MRILLFAPPIMDFVRGEKRAIAQDATHNCPPYGLYLLTAILRSAGHDVELLDLIAAGTNNVRPYDQQLRSADLVGITATSLSWPTALDVVRQIRAIDLRLPIVLGGIHPTIFDVYLLDRFPIQYVIRGEAELALPALCAAIEENRGIETVPNLSWKTKEGAVVRNAIGPLLTPQQMGQFPLPAFDLLPKGIYKGLSIESSRGCAFDCAFCATSYRQTWRSLSPDNFVDRLQAMLPQLPSTVGGTFHIIDDEFSTNTRRAKAIIRLVEQRGIRTKFVYDVRARDLLDDEFTEMVAPYTNQFLVGAECGYDEGLQRIGKKVTCAQLEAAARKLRDCGIAKLANFSFILGLPWEGRQEIEKTIDFASRLYADYGVKILLQAYSLIPGSRLWQDLRDRLIVTEAMYDDFGFFRNLHFWHVSRRLSPTDAWEIEDLINALRWLSNLAHPGQQMVQHSPPLLLAKFYPRPILKRQGYQTGLNSLRQVSHPAGNS